VAESVIREAPCPVLVFKPAGRLTRSIALHKAPSGRSSRPSRH
jgi:hypothetical protein